MNEKRKQNKDHYLVDMAQLAERRSPEVVSSLREAGRQAVRQFDYPNTTMEPWRQTNVAPLVNTPFASLIVAPDCELAPSELEALLPPIAMPVRLVFLDGYYREDLSTALVGGGATIGGLAALLDSPEAPRLEALLQDSPAPHHLFAALNSAFLQDGLFCHVPSDTVLEQPIHAVFMTSRRTGRTAAHYRNVVVLEPNAQAQLAVHHIALQGGNPYFNTCIEDLRLGPNAVLKRTEVIRETTQGYRMAVCNVRQARDSRIESYALTLDGGAITRNEIRVNVDGSNAETQLHGLYLNHGRCLVDNDLHIAHHHPHCTSHMRYKGILSDQSHSVFTGKIFVARDAQKTDSDQLCANLMLSEQARVDAKPQLEIYADDVRCTHGTTVGGPPENEVFYLRSRGINEQQARRMLTYGFAGEVVDRLPDAALKNWLMGYLSAELEDTT